jgi:PAS domain S-box-containing protein
LDTANIHNAAIQSLLHSSSIYLALIDLEGKYTDVNNAFREKFLVPDENIIGKTYEETIIPEDHEKTLRISGECIGHPRVPFGIQIRKPVPGKRDEWFTNNWEFIFLPEIQRIVALGYDISQELEVTKELHHTLTHLNSLLESVTDGYFVINRSYSLLYLNKISASLFKSNIKEALNKSIWEFWPDDKSELSPWIDNAFNSSKSQRFDYQCQDNGRWFHFSLFPSEIGLTVVFRDISEEKINIKRLEDSENHLRFFVNSTTDINILVDRNHRIMMINDKAKEAIQQYFGEEPLIGDDFQKYLWPGEPVTIYYDAFKKGLEGQKTELEYEIKSDFGNRWFLYRYFPVYDSNQDFFGFAINTSDIDQRKRVEEKVKESEVLLSAIYNSSSDAITFLNTDGTIRYFNEACKNILQRESNREPENETHFQDYMHPSLKEEHASYFERALGGETILLEFEHLSKWYAFKYFPVYDDEKVIIGVVQSIADISQRINFEKTISNQSKQLDTIAWLQSHELRGPLSNIIGLVNLLQEENGLDQRASFRYLQEASQQLDKAIQKIVFNSLDKEGKA